MGATEPPAIESLTPADAAAGLALSTAAGWNQTSEDWLLFLRHGEVFGMRGPGGQVVATAALLPYRGVAAWISMVLVAAAWRRRGLASVLMRRCLAAADQAGQQTWLDATPAGAAVYGWLGFEPTGNLVRLRRPATADEGTQQSPRAAAGEGGGMAALLAFDREAFGFDRSAILTNLAARPRSEVVGGGEAACLVRDGRRARQIGPVYGRSGKDAGDLLARVAAAEEAELVIDLHGHENAVPARLGELGFAPERPFLRMVRGRKAAARCEAVAFAGAGPEYG